MIGFIHGLFVGSCLLAAAGIAVHSKSTIKYDLAHFGTAIHHLKTVGVITPAHAKEIVISDAGLITKDVTFSKVDTEFEDGSAKIVLEFMYHGVEYDYETDAKTGQILDSKVGPAFYE